MMPDTPLTVAEAGDALRSGRLTSVELVDRCFSIADRVDGLLGTYICRFDDAARAAAAQADAELAEGTDRGPLHGIPVGVKDIVATREGPTTAQSLAMDMDWGRGVDAPVVARLREGGAVVTGKLSTMEFALGMNEACEDFPLPRNPWAPECWTGGSSSGAASGVAAGMFMVAVGTDTAASVRMPAAFCGVSGLKPTYGLVPASGVVPLAESLDHVGPLACSVRDCGAVLDVMIGARRADAGLARPPGSSDGDTWSGDLTGLRVGVERGRQPVGSTDPAVAVCFDRALEELAAAGAEIVDVALPLHAEVNTAVMVTMFSEALARHRERLGARWGRYLGGTRELLALGALATGADYVQAQRVRQRAQVLLARVFEDVDVIAAPTAHVAAPTFERIGREGVLTVFQSVDTAYWNGVGNPALAVPMGENADGLPLSMQLAGRPFEEATLLRAGHAYQQRTDWHRRRPEVPTGTEDRYQATEGAT